MKLQTAVIFPTVVFFLGCDNAKIKLPKSDTTKPALTWNVYDLKTSLGKDYSGNPTINAKKGDQYRVTLKANDPDGGVKSISIGGAMTWQCVSFGGGENTGAGSNADLAPLTQDLSPDANQNVLTSIFLIENVDLTLWCDPGYVFSGGSADLIGSAKNYFDGTTTSTLKFSITP